jgi:hypothetical protein
MPPPKNGQPDRRGRPTRLTPAMCEQLALAVEAALTITAAAKSLGMNHSLVSRRMDKDPAFAEKIHQAQERALDTLESSVFGRAMSGDNFSTAMILNGWRRERYKPSVDVNHEISESMRALIGIWSAERDKASIPRQAPPEALPPYVDAETEDEAPGMLLLPGENPLDFARLDEANNLYEEEDE